MDFKRSSASKLTTTIIAVVATLVLGDAGLAQASAPGPKVIAPATRAMLGEPDLEAAGRAFKTARKHYKANRFSEALTAALAGWRAAPSDKAAHIVAVILVAVDRPCEAVGYLLSGLDTSPAAAGRKALEETLAEACTVCSKGMGWTTLVSARKDIEVTLGNRTFRTPQSVALVAGKHRVSVSAPGHITEMREISIRPGAGERTELALLRIPPMGLEPTVRTYKASQARTSAVPVSRDQTLANVLVGSGIVTSLVFAALSTGVIFDGFANPPATNTEVDDLNTLSLGLWLGGFLAGGAMVAAGVASYDHGPSAVSVAPWVSPESTGLLVGGGF